MTRTLRSQAMLSVLAALLLAMVVGDETSTAGPGDTVFVAAGTWMELANRSDAVARAVPLP